MLLLSRGLLVSFRDLLDTAGYDVRVVANEGSPIHRAPLAGAPSLADAIRRLPGVQRVALLRTGNATAMTPGHENTAVGVTLIGSTETRDGRRVGHRQRVAAARHRRRRASRPR